MLFALALSPALAADHVEAPGTIADPAADINDFFAWSEAGSLNLIISFAPLLAPGAIAYDRDVLYQVHIDSNGDQIADQTIDVRFGQNSSAVWGVQVSGLGGAPIVGPVGSVTSSGSNSVYAGLTDDPFFFDLQGFQQTLATGTVAFDSTRDSFAGANVHAIAIQTAAPQGPVSIWATTSRF